MGRAYTRLPLHLWRTSAFVELSVHAQWLYAVLIGQQSMSFVGVVPVTIERWANAACDVTARDVTMALDLLRATHWVVVDERTQELLVPAFAAHVGSLDSPNMRKASAEAYSAVLSSQLRAVIAGLLPRAHVAQVTGEVEPAVERVVLHLDDVHDPTSGKGLREGLPKVLPKVLAEGLAEGLPKGLAEGLRDNQYIETTTRSSSSIYKTQAEAGLRGCEDDDPRVAAAMWALAAADLEDARERCVAAAAHPDYLKSLAEDRAEQCGPRARALAQLHPDATGDAIALLLADDEHAQHE